MSDPAPVALARRLFTALFPPPEACAAIDAERRRWGGLPHRLHPMPERMHLTLQFYNRVDAPHERAWLQALAGLRFQPFEITLSHAEHWRVPSGNIAVLRPAPNPALDALHAATGALARGAGLPGGTQAVQPHLTILRRAEHATLAPLTRPVSWRVQQLVLVWSDLQAQPPRYHRLGEFPAA